MSLRDAWEEQAPNWIRWARAEGHSRAFEGARLQIAAMRELYDDENPRWSRVPLFLRFEAVKPA